MSGNSFVHFQFFCAGTLIALFLRGRVIDVALPLRIAGFALGFCLWLTAMIHFRVQSWDPQPTPAGSVIGWLLVLAATSLFFLAALGTPSRYIPPWLAYFGRISYGLYMVHSLMFFLIFEKAGPYIGRLFPGVHLPAMLTRYLGTLLVLLLSLLLAHLSFKYFERRFLLLKKRFTFVASREEVKAVP